MNEFLFFLQTFLMIIFALGALRLGESALTSWIVVQALLANFFVLKQILLFGFEVTASDVYAIGSMIGLNFLQEYFSKQSALKATWICFFFMVFFVIFSQLHLIYHASPSDISQDSYHTLLSWSPQLSGASMGVFFISQRFDIAFFSFLKNSVPTMAFAWRALTVTVCSQALDTILFTLIGLHGIIHSIVDVILVSLLIKLCAVFFISPLLKWIKI